MDFKKKVIYQIYPKSFNDSNDDGIGDLRGIIEKLPYLYKLGVDIIWINPFFVSPQRDNGYDIADYTSIDSMFGTMEDFEKLVYESKKYNIELMLDMVLNHTSTEHKWFKKALAGDKKYQDFYFIREGKENNQLPTNWKSKFGGNAWGKFGDTDKYYLHLYDVTQADLNWRNPKVREELYKVVNFWIDKGVKGFRFDVINVIGKDEELKDSTNNIGKEMYTDKPIVHEFIKEMNKETFGRVEGITTVGEMSSTTIENCILYSSPEEKELSMTFNFHHLKVDYENGEKWSDIHFDFMMLKKLLNEWQEKIESGGGWNALFWNNHDQPRAISRFCNEKYRVEASKMLAATIHLLRGTPYIYQGEEIGMTNPNFEKMDDYLDVETHNAYNEFLKDKIEKETIMNIIKSKSRDNSRTPMQWSDKLNSGFTNGKPWIKIAENYKEINVEKELKEGSIFNFYQKLISLRKQLNIISEGSYKGILLDNDKVYAYVRNLEKERLIVFNNFYDCEVEVEISEEFLGKSFTYLIGNYEKRDLEPKLKLRPYETVAFYSNDIKK
ncbi:alpha,alpha-phosphotrehalase [Clostridioides difficile]